MILAFSLVLVGTAVRQIVLEADTLVATGVIVDVGRPYRGGRTIGVEFTTADGQQCRAWLDAGQGSNPRLGGSYRVYYYPDKGCVDAGNSPAPASLVCFAVIFFLIGAGGTWIAWRHTGRDGRIRGV